MADKMNSAIGRLLLGKELHTAADMSGVITVEEGIDCREANSRSFSLINRESGLMFTISKCSIITSCQLNGHEIVVDPRKLNQNHESWAIGDRPYQKMNSLAWNCHVRGNELLLSASNGSSSILYELTRANELKVLVKLKSLHLQQQATYLNLNNCSQKVPIDGHTIVVRCNGNLDRIRVQNTKLLCQCNTKATVLPQSLVGNVPFELVRNNISLMESATNNDDLIICDAVYSLETNCTLDFLRVQLQYLEKIVMFEIRSIQPNSNAQNMVYPTTILRMRVRVTNFGVCMMPYMMTNYTCIYRVSY